MAKSHSYNRVGTTAPWDREATELSACGVPTPGPPDKETPRKVKDSYFDSLRLSGNSKVLIVFIYPKH